MKRRLFCLLCVLLLLFPVLAPAEEVSEDSNFSFDFDFAFRVTYIDKDLCEIVDNEN